MGTSSRSFRIFGTSLANDLSSHVAIAASRAGHTGLLNLEFSRASDGAVRREILRLAKHARGSWGVKLRASAVEGFLPADLTILADLPVVALILDDHSALDGAVAHIRTLTPDAEIWVELTDATALSAVEHAGVSGVIAKGHEAGGRVGDETSLLLTQRMVRETTLPVIAMGGVGPHSAAALRVAGAQGVVLDWQLALMPEAATPTPIARAISRMDGSETNLLGHDVGVATRVFWRADHKAAQALQAHDIPGSDPATFLRELDAAVDPTAPETSVWLVGQDAAFADRFAKTYGRVGAALDAIARKSGELVALAQETKPLSENSALAASNGTRFPIIQGPMTRVSDTADFAKAVADGGALPFLALALMRKDAASTLLADTKAKVGDAPWGVGILGFVDDDLRAEQTEVILEHRPDFALIAGGRPDQALSLEKQGIPTYLHVPSPGLVSLFLESGTRRFIFEGRECGGHVGPRTSAVLWQQAVDAILDHYGPTGDIDCEILFAGGVHDDVSGAMVSALGAELAARGAKIGVVVGTAYILTKEAIEAGAILPTYQQLALSSSRTMLLESGPGHATRVVESPIVDEFFSVKADLRGQDMDPDAIKDALEEFNVGRSRIASKGMDRNPEFGKVDGAPRLIAVSDEDQKRLGVYMIGQVANLHDQATTIADLHDGICVASGEVLDRAVAEPRVAPVITEGPGANIAITGFGTKLPKAASFNAYWENILDRIDAIEEVPERRWDWRRYYDENRDAPDKIYSRWGGFLDEMEFDPIKYGIPPNSMPSIEPLQLLALETVREALENAGFEDGHIADPELRKRTSVIIGVGGGAGPLGQRYAVRSSMPAINGGMTKTAEARLPEWTEDSFPGILLNVIAGRVANRFDLGGVNFTVDAACGSSLAAVMMAAREIENGTSDMAVVGGADSFQNPFDFLAFSKTRALSQRGRCRTFDAGADGIAISEGLAMLVLRKMDQAEADGDRIYAVLRGVGGSSDGKDLSLTAPRPEGQETALIRAYQRAGVSPATVGLVEAHGTGTVVGDRTEIQSLSKTFADFRDDKQFCGVGSVKSMIGHTKAAAGCAGMIKVATALHTRVLPSTLHVETPNPGANFPESPFYVVTEARPWMNYGQTPRRAGVSAFGFGGTNFHAVLEEYDGGYLPQHRSPLRKNWTHELYLFSAADKGALQDALRAAATAMASAPASVRAADVSAALADQYDASAGARFAIVAPSMGDAASRILRAIDMIGQGGDALSQLDPMGAFYAGEPALTADQVAFLFPGQGSQYPGMAGDLAMLFPEVREVIEDASIALMEKTPEPLGDLIYPRPTLDEAEKARQVEALKRTDVAQPAIGAVSVALHELLRDMGLSASATIGHSYGEYTALHAAGAFDADTLVHLAHARGDAIIRAGGDDLGAMAAVNAGPQAVSAALPDNSGVTLANMNAPEQTVIAGPTDAIMAVLPVLEQAGLAAKRLPVACGFHSDCVAPAKDLLAGALDAAAISAPALPVIGNATAAPYGDNADSVRAQLASHLTDPVNFTGGIEALHERGVRLFLEVGPGAVLARLSDRILGDREHLSLSADMKGRPGAQQLLCLLGGAMAAGLPLNLARVFEGRVEAKIDVKTWDLSEAPDPRRAMKWMIDAANARPIDGQPARRGFAARIEEDPVSQPERPAPAAPVAQPAAAAPAPAAAAAPATPVARAQGAAVSGPVSDDIMRRHQELMAQFLENNRAVMMNWLGTSGQELPAGMPMPATAPAPAPVSTPVAAAPVADPAPVAAPAPAPAPVAVEPAHAPVAAPVTAPAPAGLSEEGVTNALLALISDRTGYPTDMLDLDLNLEADLGIDSIKRVEILGALRGDLLADAGEAAREQMGPVSREKTVRGIVAKFMEVAEQFAPTAAAAPVAAAPVAASAPAPVGLSEDGVTNALLALISDRTGYPTDMLDLDLNLEADLGIDSIKRVEILGALRGDLLADAGEAAREQMGPVSREKTVRGIVAKFMEVAEQFAPAAAAPVAAAPVAASAPAPVGLSEDGVTNALLALISDRTGYPTDMLDLDLNLEADLGIDSIKRVEILGALRGDLLADAGEAAREQMGPVSREKTVRGIVAKFMEVAEQFTGTAPVAVTPLAAVDSTPVADLPEFADWPARFVMAPRALDYPKAQAWVTPGATYVLSDDGTGVATGVADAITAQGGEVTLIPTAQMGDDAALRAAVAQLGTNVAGLIHCAPLAEATDFDAMERAEWTASVDRATRGFYSLLNALGPVISERGDGVVMCATAMGGAFGFDGAGVLNPADGGAPGLLKTVAKEWEHAHCRAVDFAAEITPATRAEILMAEGGRRDGLTEIGHGAGGRVGLFAELIKVPTAGAGAHPLVDGDVVLVTGGARGITAKITRDMAKRAKLRFVLLGSSPVPVGSEPAHIAGITDEKKIKAALITAAKESGQPLNPKAVEAEFWGVIKAREIRDAMAQLTGLGAEVEYLQCDVRDDAGFAALIGDVTTRYGKIDGVLHGAGVIEDKLVLDKEVDSFDRVMRTKTESAFTLTRALNPETLKFAVFFTSVAGRFGNRGQGDYGAANETVSKLARLLNARWPGVIKATSWGPWDSGGMVNDEIKAQFAEMRIEPIPPELGVQACTFEITHSDDTQPEVVWGRGPWEDDDELYRTTYATDRSREAAE